MRRKAMCWATLLLLGLALPARADYISRSFQFSLSDSLPRGPSFGTVTIEAYDGTGAAGGGLQVGQVRMTFQPTKLPIEPYGPGYFGFEQAGFNTNLSLQPSQIRTATGWNAGWGLRGNRSMGGFGQFQWQVDYYYDVNSATSLPHGNPLVVIVSGLGTNATLDHFLIPSTNLAGGAPVNGSVYFAGRISGFDLNTDLYDLTSQVVGVNVVPSPEPSALLLGLGGMLLMFSARAWFRGR
jgi:hypothetical protein